MEREFLKKIIYIIVDIVYYCYLPIGYIISSLYPIWVNIYSRWICRKYNIKNALFEYPVNRIEGGKFFQFAPNISFGKYTVITCWERRRGQTFHPSLIIDENCNFGDYLHLTCTNEIKIGSGVLTGRWVTISDNSHGISALSQLSIPPIERDIASKGKIVIGKNVWIGDKVTILSGVTIGEGAIIGANSVVTKDVPPFTIVIGNSMKILSPKS